MHTISDTINRKFIDSVSISNFEIETDTGWHPISKIIKTVNNQVWKLQTESGFTLECADDHIVFDNNLNEIFVKDVTLGSYVQTSNGPELVTTVCVLDRNENMFDITVDSEDHRYYTSGILSHNTTILQALSYVIYGEAINNIRKDNLINVINKKNMLVTFTLHKDGNDYRIERGRKPNVLKFYVNNIEQDSLENDAAQGDMRETQKDLHDLLGMNHETFKHIVALNTYTTPFLAMKANDQRNMIEQLLGITLLSEKAESLKELIKDSKDKIYQASADIEAIKRSNEGIQKSIDNLLIRQTAWNKQYNESIEKIANAIAELSEVDIEQELKLHDDLAAYTDYANKLRIFTKEKATVEAALGQAEKTLTRYSNELESLANKKCHTCDQSLQDHKHESLTEIAMANVLDAKSYVDKLNSDLLKIINDINDLGSQSSKPVTFYDTNTEALRHQHNLETLNEQLIIKYDEKDPYQEQIDDLNNTAMQEIEWDKINALTALKEHQEFLLKLLTNKDSFIRKKIIDQNLLHLNNRLSFYLDSIGLPHSVTFQNDLSVEITQLGQSLDFHNLSRGEMTRLILSLSFAFRDVWQALNQPINLLFVDELADMGIDSAGLEKLLSILKKTTRETNKSVWIISHRDELISRVDNIVTVVKENGFSSFLQEY